MISHLERELQIIERRLQFQEQSASDQPLVLYKRFIATANHRIKMEHRNGGSGKLVARERSQIIDLLLTHLWQKALKEIGESKLKQLPPLALIATGGFGRNELSPCSDVDVMFLHAPASPDREQEIHTLIEQVLYLLWDLGLKVGHSTRVIQQVIRSANEDLKIKTSLLDSRLLIGDKILFQDFQNRFLQKCLSGMESEYIDWRLRDQQLRHANQGGSVFMQEPNVKEGCGGLRDYHHLMWVAFAWKRIRTVSELAERDIIARSESKQIERAYDFLLRVRAEMHFRFSRANDQLALSQQGIVAHGLGYEQRPPIRRVETFMRDYYRSAQDIFFLTNAAAQRIADLHAMEQKKWFPFISRNRIPVQRVDGFLIRGNEITSESKTIFNEDASRLLRVFLLAQKRNLSLSFDLLRLIRRRTGLVNRAFIYAKTTREMLVEIMSQKGKVGHILRLMHQTGLLGKLFPEFAPLTCLVQHEFFHRYSADEHTLVCMEQLDGLIAPEANNPSDKNNPQDYQQLFKTIEDPFILYLALLLHDTGKAEDTRHHSEISANLALRVARRFRLPTESRETLVFLVDHHLTLSRVAQRRNLDDIKTIQDFARIVGTEARLDLLMLLTYADGRGTTGGAGWSDWKEALSWQLYRYTRLMLQDSPEFERKSEEEFHERVKRVFEKLPRSILEEEANIHLATLPRRYVQVNSDSEIIRHLGAVHQFYRLQVDEESNPLNPILVWTHHEDRGHSELVVVTWNREQLFAKIAGSLAVAELNILSADIFTREDNIVVDIFRISTDLNKAITDERDRKQVANLLSKALTQPQFDFESLLQKAQSRRTPPHWFGGTFPTKITLDNHVLQDHTLLEIETPDHPGLLYDLAKNITQEGIQIDFARIETEKGAAIDSFYLVDRIGNKISDGDLLARLKRRVLKCTDSYPTEKH